MKNHWMKSAALLIALCVVIMPLTGCEALLSAALGKPAETSATLAQQSPTPSPATTTARLGQAETPPPREGVGAADHFLRAYIYATYAVWGEGPLTEAMLTEQQIIAFTSALCGQLPDLMEQYRTQSGEYAVPQEEISKTMNLIPRLERLSWNDAVGAYGQRIEDGFIVVLGLSPDAQRLPAVEMDALNDCYAKATYPSGLVAEFDCHWTALSVLCPVETYEIRYTQSAPQEGDGAPSARSEPSADGRIAVAKVQESSAADAAYAGAFAADDDPSSYWASADGDTANAWIKIYFDGPQKINRLMLLNGSQRDADYYKKSGRVKKFQMTFSDGSSREFTVKSDLYGEYTLYKIPETTTEYVSIKVLDVYKGEDKDNVVIAQAEFYMAGAANADVFPRPTPVLGNSDKTGYKPVHFSFDHTRGDGDGYGDNPAMPAGKWLSADGNSVLYIEYSDSPDGFFFELVWDLGTPVLGSAPYGDLESEKWATGYDMETYEELYRFDKTGTGKLKITDKATGKTKDMELVRAVNP